MFFLGVAVVSINCMCCMRPRLTSCGRPSWPGSTGGLPADSEWRHVCAAGSTACVRCLLWCVCASATCSTLYSCQPLVPLCFCFGFGSVSALLLHPTLRSRFVPYVFNKGQWPLRPHWISDESQSMLLASTSRHPGPEDKCSVLRVGDRIREELDQRMHGVLGNEVGHLRRQRSARCRATNCRTLA